MQAAQNEATLNELEEKADSLLELYDQMMTIYRESGTIMPLHTVMLR